MTDPATDRASATQATAAPASATSASPDGRAIWDELTGQSEAVALLAAASSPRATARDATGTALAHSWLITGPPGSGRSNLAYAFATALLSDGTPEGDAATARQVAARSHPDLGVLATERVIIAIDEVRALVTSSQYSPSVGRYRVMVVEDADRMTERTSNLLLKALEEPPERTIWILCAPSEADLIPTIRSRVRSVRLRIPSVEDVAALIQRRDGVDAATATRAAREAQSHIGMAHRLATDAEARERRSRTLELALGIRSVGDAVRAAAAMLELAGQDAKAFTVQRDADERERALRSLGVQEGGSIPPQLRSQIRQLEEDQKRRATRSLRDGIDRILVDLMSLHRDVLLHQLGADLPQVNEAIAPRIAEAAEAGSAAASLAVLDAVGVARRRIDGNVSPALALEAMLVSITRTRPAGRA